MGYFRLGSTSFSTITRELRVVEFFGLHIRNPDKILHIFDVSNVKKNEDFFQKNSFSSRAHTSFTTLKIHKKTEL